MQDTLFPQGPLLTVHQMNWGPSDSCLSPTGSLGLGHSFSLWPLLAQPPLSDHLLPKRGPSELICWRNQAAGLSPLPGALAFTELVLYLLAAPTPPTGPWHLPPFTTCPGATTPFILLPMWHTQPASAPYPSAPPNSRQTPREQHNPLFLTRGPQSWLGLQQGTPLPSPRT